MYQTDYEYTLDRIIRDMESVITNTDKLIYDLSVEDTDSNRADVLRATRSKTVEALRALRNAKSEIE